MWTTIFIILAIVFFISTMAILCMHEFVPKFGIIFITSFLLLIFSMCGAIISAYCYYDVYEYRELYQPTIKDVNDGYAKIDSIGVVNNIPQYKITWIGNQTGKREQ